MSLRGHIHSQGPKDEKGVRHGAPWGVVVELGEQEVQVCPKCIGERGAPVNWVAAQLERLSLTQRGGRSDESDQDFGLQALVR